MMRWLSGLGWLGCMMSSMCVADSMEGGVPGRMVTTRETILSSAMSGRIEQMYYREMQSVEEGEVLISMDCLALEGELTKTLAMHDAALKKAEILRSLQALASVGELEVVLADSEVQVAAASVKVLEGQLSRCQLRVPFAGVLYQIMVEPHQYVTEGQPLVELVSLRDLEVELLLPSAWLSWLSPEASFKMAIKETGQTHEGYLVRIDSVVDFGSQTIRGRGVITPQGAVRLLPGMSGTAYFSKQTLN